MSYVVESNWHTNLLLNILIDTVNNIIILLITVLEVIMEILRPTSLVTPDLGRELQ